jgi:spore coat polysaccharide biosynthesis protein SpsF
MNYPPIAATDIGIIIQARLGSSRLPSKIAQKITDEHNLLEFLIQPLTALGLPMVLAFPDTEEHRRFSQSLQLSQVSFFFGSNENVLDRYLHVAEHFGFDSVVRVCGDNPFLNVSFLGQLVHHWDGSLDYLSYFNSAGTPAIRTHFGLFSEIARVSALKEVARQTTKTYHLEHVTPYLYEHPELFRVGKVNMPQPFWSGVPLRFTVDTEQDLETMRIIAKNIDVQAIDDLVGYCVDEKIQLSMREQIATNSK